MQEYHSVLDFWFDELKPEQWFKKDAELDQRILSQFSVLHERAIKGELSHWRDKPEGRLAEVIILDQFSRNMFRNDAKAFVYDSLSLVLAQEAVRSGALDQLNEAQQNFLIMPYMHSESSVIHEEAMKLREQYGLELRWQQAHKDIIDRFGRYPHRNKILGRESMTEEVEFLKQPGSSF
ncbi:DUF924 family protein [uncultured Endozoicomonas sp.]|uniref:DUF924 family protein n=1 Tax=uncultured Endozoicomonas sp. TaxID=432652 RepID=UPI00262F6D2C|nr:DUF924 family protein [uncultured Endozoicomonas sp.]